MTDSGEIDMLFGAACEPGVATRVTCGRWQFGVVMPVRAGLRPVRMLARVGEQRGLHEDIRFMRVCVIEGLKIVR